MCQPQENQKEDRDENAGINRILFKNVMHFIQKILQNT